jgi:hypothetical protein
MIETLQLIKATAILWSGLVVCLFWLLVSHWIAKSQREMKSRNNKTLSLWKHS